MWVAVSRGRGPGMSAAVGATRVQAESMVEGNAFVVTELGTLPMNRVDMNDCLSALWTALHSDDALREQFCSKDFQKTFRVALQSAGVEE